MVLHVNWGSCSGPLPTVYVVVLCDELEFSTQRDPSDIVSIVKCEPTAVAHTVDRDECLHGEGKQSRW